MGEYENAQRMCERRVVRHGVIMRGEGGIKEWSCNLFSNFGVLESGQFPWISQVVYAAERTFDELAEKDNGDP